MPSDKSTAENIREERELARKNREKCLILVQLSLPWLISFSSSCSLRHVPPAQGYQLADQNERQWGQGACPVFLRL